MENDSLLFVRFVFFTSLSILFLPLLLLVEAVKEISRRIFAASYCKSIAGEIAVVTGGAHGLGRELSINLAKNGCHIAVVDINIAGAEETAKIVSEKYNVKAKAYQVDVTNYEQVVELNANITKDLGTATILVNNAGVLIFSNLANPDWREVQRMINVNLTAHFWTNRVFLPKMKELRKGHIVAISSLSSMLPLIFNSEYTSTKYAIRGMMRVLRQDLKFGQFKNIHTTTAYPYFLQTNDNVYQLTQKTGMDAFLPAIPGDQAAERIVRGILQNELQIVWPYYHRFLYLLLEILPAQWSDLLMMAPSGSMLNRYDIYTKSQ